jgi:hypothetical protein
MLHSQLPHHFALKPYTLRSPASATSSRARLARLEAHRGAGRDVEAEAARRRAVEGERALVSKKW